MPLIDLCPGADPALKEEFRVAFEFCGFGKIESKLDSEHIRELLAGDNRKRIEDEYILLNVADEYILLNVADERALVLQVGGSYVEMGIYEFGHDSEGDKWCDCYATVEETFAKELKERILKDALTIHLLQQTLAQS